MQRSHLTDFAPHTDLPLLASFLVMALELGHKSISSFDYWDAYVLDSKNKPYIAVRAVQKGVTESVLAHVVSEQVPLKVILVEGKRPQLAYIDSKAPFLAMAGCGVFVRGVGWRVLPNSPNAEVIRDMQLKMAPRWSFDEASQTWMKACTKCGELQTTEDFYRANYPTARDPYRNICISCFSRKED